MNTDAIDWLRSPEGQDWSKIRIQSARRRAFFDLSGDPVSNPYSYQRLHTGRNPELCMPGMFDLRQG